MKKPGWIGALAVTLAAFAALASTTDAQARGGGGPRGGGFHGGGFHGGHVGRPGRLGLHGSFGHRHGFHHGRFGRHDRFGHRRGHRGGHGGMPWLAGYGAGGAGGYDGGFRAPSQPAYGIPPSPVLPPAIYVIGPKAGSARGHVPVVRKGRGGGALTAGSNPEGGSSASVMDRRHRMH